MTELYICVHVPEFSAQALVRLRSDLTRLPVVVLQGEPPLEEVCSANIPALRLGVRHGMTRAELDSFTGLNILQRSVVEERSARAALLDAAGAFAPRIEVQAAKGSAWVMVLDMTGSSRMFGTIDHTIQRIARAVKMLRFSVRLAASSNLHAAVCIAPSAVRIPRVIPHGEESKHLASLPLAALELSEQESEAFELWGLQTFGDLAALPEVDLVVRLGQRGKRLNLLARGQYPHLMVPEEPVFALEEVFELEAPVDVLDSLLFVLGTMLGQLISRAQNHALALASLTARLGLYGGGEHVCTIKPALPLADRKVLLKLLQLDLQTHPPPAAIVRVLLSAEPGERSKVQLGLFSPQLPDSVRLDVTLARISALVGEAFVGRATLQDTHKPDRFLMERFCVPSTPGGALTAAEAVVAMRRCRPPVVLHMKRDGQRLHQFQLRGALYAVEQAYGPWRRSGEWWSQQVWSFEEWDVQATAQSGTLLCLISHDLLHNQWQLEALYD